jgi:hypothetical protein
MSLLSDGMNLLGGGPAQFIAIVLALLTTATLVFTAVMTYRGRVDAASASSEATAANKAVNNRGKSEPVIYDMVRDTHQAVMRMSDKVDELVGWKAGYEGSALTDGAAVERLVNKVDRLGDRLNGVQADVVKYGCPGKTGMGERDPNCILLDREPQKR